MKITLISFIQAIGLIFLLHEAGAQPAGNLKITYNKTTTIVFEAPVRSVDRGSRDVLVQKAKETENIIFLKAARHGFPETNLTVITGDGRVHSFRINYAADLAGTVLYSNTINPKSKRDSSAIFPESTTPLEIAAMCKQAEHLKSRRIKSRKKNKVAMHLLGIYGKDDVILFRLQLKNTSNIRYDVESLRFYIRDQQKIKRSASHEIELKPLLIRGGNNQIAIQSDVEITYALEKFTIPDAKHLVIELLEHQGGRNLNMKITNARLVKADALK